MRVRLPEQERSMVQIHRIASHPVHTHAGVGSQPCPIGPFMHWWTCTRNFLKKLGTKLQHDNAWINMWLVTCGCMRKFIKYSTTGWHEGTYLEYTPHGGNGDKSPNGIAWTWQECAAECAKESRCEFWTLRDHVTSVCMLLANRGAYHRSKYRGRYVEGEPL